MNVSPTKDNNALSSLENESLRCFVTRDEYSSKAVIPSTVLDGISGCGLLSTKYADREETDSSDLLHEVISAHVLLNSPSADLRGCMFARE